MGTFYALVTPGPDSALILGKAYWLADHDLAFSEEGLSLLDVYHAWKVSGRTRQDMAGIARWYRETGVPRALFVSEHNEERYPHTALKGHWPANYAEILDVENHYRMGFRGRKYAPRGRSKDGRPLPSLGAPLPPTPRPLEGDPLLDLCVTAALRPWGR